MSDTEPETNDDLDFVNHLIAAAEEKVLNKSSVKSGPDYLAAQKAIESLRDVARKMGGHAGEGDDDDGAGDELAINRAIKTLKRVAPKLGGSFELRVVDDDEGGTP